MNDGVILLSLGVGAPPMLPQGEIPVSFTDKDGAFNKDLAERYIQNGLRRSVGEFTDGQVDEYLAQHDARPRRIHGQRERRRKSGTTTYARTTPRTIKFIRFTPAYFNKNKPKTTSRRALNAWIADNGRATHRRIPRPTSTATPISRKQVRARHVFAQGRKLRVGRSEERRPRSRPKSLLAPGKGWASRSHELAKKVQWRSHHGRERR